MANEFSIPWYLSHYKPFQWKSAGLFHLMQFDFIPSICCTFQLCNSSRFTDDQWEKNQFKRESIFALTEINGKLQIICWKLFRKADSSKTFDLQEWILIKSPLKIHLVKDLMKNFTTWKWQKKVIKLWDRNSLNNQAKRFTNYCK